MKTRYKTYPDKQKTKPSVMILSIFILWLIVLGISILLYELFKETGSLPWTMLTGSISFTILFLIIYWLFSDAFSETEAPKNKSYKKLRKGRNSTFLEKHFNQDINFQNHQNYYTNASIVEHLKKQLFWSHYSEKILILIAPIAVLNYLALTAFYSFFLVYGYLPFLIFLLSLSMLYLSHAKSDYTKFKKTQTGGRTYFLNRNITRYYFYNGDLFLY